MRTSVTRWRVFTVILLFGLGALGAAVVVTQRSSGTRPDASVTQENAPTASNYATAHGSKGPAGGPDPPR